MAKKMKKYSDDNPTMRAIHKYEQEIAALQKKYEQANEEHDWSMRHFYYNQMQAKRSNMQLLIDKMKRRMPNAGY